MLQISNTDTLQYKDCLGTTIGIEVAKEKTSTQMIFKWSFETVTYLIKDIQLLTKDKYLINTDSGKITLILNDKNKLIATIYIEGQGEGTHEST